MSLWEQYKKNRGDELLIEGLPNSMESAIFSWLYEVAKHHLTEPYKNAVEIKNIFRINGGIPRQRPNNYAPAEPEYSFAQFILIVGRGDPLLFFTILDYLVQEYLSRDDYPIRLEKILAGAGHKYTVIRAQGTYTLTERLPEEHKKLMENLLQSSEVYASEFYDAFVKIYGQKPEYTEGAGEAFQALESALKKFLGEDKGRNLGDFFNWLESHQEKWKYRVPSKGQDDAEKHFMETVNFVNKSYRAVKHGHALEKLAVGKQAAETILRAVSLLIFELENTIELVKD